MKLIITKLSRFLTFLLLVSIINSQTIEFTPGNEGTAYLKYNIAMSTASTAAGVGGFTASCTAGCNDDNTYRIGYLLMEERIGIQTSHQ